MTLIQIVCKSYQICIIRRCLYFVHLITFHILGQIFVKFFVGFLENLKKNQKDILKLTDLQRWVQFWNDRPNQMWCLWSDFYWNTVFPPALPIHPWWKSWKIFKSFIIGCIKVLDFLKNDSQDFRNSFSIQVPVNT